MSGYVLFSRTLSRLVGGCSGHLFYWCHSPILQRGAYSMCWYSASESCGVATQSSFQFVHITVWVKIGSVLFILFALDNGAECKEISQQHTVSALAWLGLHHPSQLYQSQLSSHTTNIPNIQQDQHHCIEFIPYSLPQTKNKRPLGKLAKDVASHVQRFTKPRTSRTRPSVSSHSGRLFRVTRGSVHKGLTLLQSKAQEMCPFAGRGWTLSVFRYRRVKSKCKCENSGLGSTVCVIVVGMSQLVLLKFQVSERRREIVEGKKSQIKQKERELSI